MRLDGPESDNVEDRRGSRSGPMLLGGGGMGMVVILIVYTLLGGNPLALLNQMQRQGPPPQQQQADAPLETTPEEEEMVSFVKRVLASTEQVWTEQFRADGEQYQLPRLVLFRDRVQSACGGASAAMGPFYCPGDAKVYLDLAFYDEMRDRFHAGGDFAQAYVIAHEIGHHVQNLLGISDRVHAAQGRPDFNEQSVRLELQADFLAGLWAHHANKKRPMLEEGDVEEAIQAATAIGDDRLQKQSQGYVVPDSFTHGSSEQRVRWFMKGLKSGKFTDGNTFAIPYDQL
ncbi:neutral zinc metallopeptidase [Planctomyces sp. SH-PL14]|uniref:KPN_02809 family neutral zinc metallopeptidase n=1 Tax=Planctomyces sp. SH-PL14 TaxID=1632864 RepID=UPI00078DB7B2|nr:neutral zinc metallopeptidase [Planctomyces sp. SH-PL14]AMV21557.1 Putative neutral zinc metallopeptidase [Planctomyces sp. SH-PL14]